MIVPYKREKWSHLVVNSGFDRYVVPIFHACAGSRKVPLLKTLLSSYCQNNCKFCAFRCERKIERERWPPEDLARITMKLWRMGKINGLFLSSCVEKDPEFIVEKEVETVGILRGIGFTAYVHLRVMPGTSRELIKKSIEISDRVGINIEFPRAEYYDDMKIFLDFRQDIIRRLKWISSEVEKAQKQGKCKAGLDTQMIVGASNETDKEILQITDWLYHKLKARRVYYSAFEPVADTPLENKPAENRWREYRLYQCSFLIQKYNFHGNDMILNNEMLPFDGDPKFLIAKQNELLVDVNDADYEELVKVPGIGLKTAKNIILLRNKGTKFNDAKQLKSLGVILERASPFLKIGSSTQKRLSNFF